MEDRARARARQRDRAEARLRDAADGAACFAELLAEAGLPPGAFNVIPGPGAVVGQAMAVHPGIDKISFTGETETGKSILRAAAGTVKRVSMELGGKSPNIVFADADLDAAAKGAINAIFYGKGELCSAGSRLLVEESVHDALMEKVVERAKKMAPGDPLDPKTRLGSLVSEKQRDNVARYVESGRKEGAKLVAGGNAGVRQREGRVLRGDGLRRRHARR